MGPAGYLDFRPVSPRPSKASESIVPCVLCHAQVGISPSTFAYNAAIFACRKEKQWVQVRPLTHTGGRNACFLTGGAALRVRAVDLATVLCAQ
jgi:hypothetical protein